MKFGIFHELPVAKPWHLLPPLSMISATYSFGDTELPLARFVMPY